MENVSCNVGVPTIGLNSVNLTAALDLLFLTPCVVEISESGFFRRPRGPEALRSDKRLIAELDEVPQRDRMDSVDQWSIRATALASGFDPFQPCSPGRPSPDIFGGYDLAWMKSTSISRQCMDVNADAGYHPDN